MLDHQGYVIVCYVVGSVVAVSFALYAFAYGWWWSHKKNANQDTEDFVTARASQNMWRIGWSFYAGSVGSWVIVTPSQYASFAGIIGVVTYAVACGLPIILIAMFGGRMTRDLPHVMSLGDFVGWRYGPIAKTTVFMITALIMCVFILAEYTTIATIFSDFVDTISWPIIVIIGCLTLSYTAYGGLAVSIATDQAQGIASMLLALIMAVYVAVTFRPAIKMSEIMSDPALGPNYFGYISIFTLPASLIGSTMMNESFWQRVWASCDRRALNCGAGIGFCCVVLLIFLSGFGGWLAFAGGYVTADTNPNVYLMQILGSRATSAVVNNWVGVLVVLLAIVMNEGAVDSLQNGLAASLSGQYLKNRPLFWTRAAVIMINIPLVVIATRAFAVLSLFLVMNLIACCAIVPLIFGLIPMLHHFATETGFVLGIFGGLLGVTATGIGVNWNPADINGSFAVGANWAWYSNNYDWKPFLASLACSTVVMLLVDGCAWMLRRRGINGPGISGVLMRIPGMKALTATPNWTPEDDGKDAGLPDWQKAGPVAAGAGS